MFVKIEGKEGLVRDMSSGAILNTSQSDYENYMNRKKHESAAKDQLAKHSDELNNIKNEISEIKQMLMALMNK